MSFEKTLEEIQKLLYTIEDFGEEDVEDIIDYITEKLEDDNSDYEIDSDEEADMYQSVVMNLPKSKTSSGNNTQVSHPPPNSNSHTSNSHTSNSHSVRPQTAPQSAPRSSVPAIHSNTVSKPLHSASSASTSNNTQVARPQSQPSLKLNLAKTDTKGSSQKGGTNSNTRPALASSSHTTSHSSSNKPPESVVVQLKKSEVTPSQVVKLDKMSQDLAKQTGSTIARILSFNVNNNTSKNRTDINNFGSICSSFNIDPNLASNAFASRLNSQKKYDDKTGTLYLSGNYNKDKLEFEFKNVFQRK